MSGHHISPNPYMAENDPNVYMSMGFTAERVASEFNVNREDMDQFAYQSHQKAAAAYDTGKFQGEIIPFEWKKNDHWCGRPAADHTQRIAVDEHLRRETTPEGLARLKPVFKPTGSVTAGNSSPLSDGAAGVIIMEAQTALRMGLTPLARFVGFSVAGVRPEIMGVGPIAAIPKLLKRTGMSMDQIDLIELNEAFASQALAVIRDLEMDPEKVNVNGGGSRSPPALLHRLQAHCHPHERDEAPQQQVWHGTMCMAAVRARRASRKPELRQPWDAVPTL